MRWKLLFLAAAAAFDVSARADTNFVAGADFSFLSFFESRGVKYKDNGVIQDGFQILTNHGINLVRLRLFTSSAAQASADPYNYINNTTYTVPLAVRVKNAGLRFCLDFHYSDTWADPGHQAIPNAWTNLSYPQLVQQMRTYNSNTIAAFAAAGVMPDYVQVGNEITGGMLWPIGHVSGNTNTSWSQLGTLMKSAIQGIQDAAGTNMPKIIVHIDRGADWANTLWFFDNLAYQGVPYDIIGESYYPFYHGPLSDVSVCLSNAAVRYGKPIFVAETAFPWNNTVTSWTNKLYGFPPTVDGQVSFIAALAQVVESVPNHLGAGVMYWSAEYQAVGGVNEAGFNTTSFFDASGNVLPVADGVGGMTAPLLLSTSINGTNLSLQWPFSGAASSLTTSPDLGDSAVWTTVPNTPQTTGAVFTVTLPMNPDASAFYRLQSN
jgi:arabinogalactan endo-1,4-beta-galactosidase